MGFSKTNSRGWGLGLLLVFFLDDDHKKKKLSSSSSSSSSSLFSSSFKSTNTRCSNSDYLMSKAQSTITICALIIFFSILIFTLSTFEPINSLSPSKAHISVSRRWLTDNYSNSNIVDINNRCSSSSSSAAAAASWFVNIWRKGVNDKKSNMKNCKSDCVSSTVALQGMGTLFRRGTKAMNDLVVAHLMEETKDEDFRLFSRCLHRSGITARSDVVFIFPSSSISVSSRFSDIIHQENELFLKLVHHFRKNMNDSIANSVTGFNVTQFVDNKRKKKKNHGEPLWGQRIHSKYTSSPEGAEEEDEFTQLSWGSVVGFEAVELDSEDSLAGFLDPVPMSLRRWACYPLLLGRVRRNFKHLMLVDVKNVIILNDALSRVKIRSSESVLFTEMEIVNKIESKPINPTVIMGGMRGFRRLSSAMLIEIVRAASEHKKKTSISESELLNQLVRNDSLFLKNIDISITTTSESNPVTSSLVI